MRRLTIIFLLTTILICCFGTTINSNKKNNKDMFKKSWSREDSLRKILNIHDSIKVLKTKHNVDWDQDIFIDYNRKSDYYNFFETRFNIKVDEEEYIKNKLKSFSLQSSDSIKTLIKNNYSFLIGTWIELHSLQGDLFVTSSCDFEGSYIIRDNLFLDKYYMDGTDVSFIENIEKLSTTKTRLTLITQEKKKLTIDFYQTNKKKETYIVVFRDKFDKYKISYMTKTKFVRNYNLVQHNCSDEMEMYNFDKTDFKRILEKQDK